MGLCFSADRHCRRHFRLHRRRSRFATIAQWLFGIFLVLFLGALVIGLAIGAKLMS
jgi:hypothetical protein